jgi:putative phage-type endonuclease
MITEEQRERRKQGIGGSDAAIILQVCPYKDIYQLWEEKTGKREAEDISDKPAVRWGNLLEAVIVSEYIRQTGHKVLTPSETFTHPEYPWMLGHIDGKIEGESKILECKTAGYNAKKDWGEPGTDQVPLHYLVQTQHYLAVTGCELADVAVLIAGSDFRIYTIKRDEGIVKHLIEQERNFWEVNVLQDIEPVIDMKVRRRRAA